MNILQSNKQSFNGNVQLNDVVLHKSTFIYLT